MIPTSPNLVRKLQIRSLKVSTVCEGQDPCTNCDPDVMELTVELCRLPKLKSALINYHGDAKFISQMDLWAFNSPDGHHQMLTCIGVGKYLLEGRPGRPAPIELKDEPLDRIWHALVAANTPSDAGRYSFAWAVAMSTAMRSLRPMHAEYGKKYMKHRILRLIVLMKWHDQGWVPLAFAQIWPSQVPLDFRQVESFGLPKFLDHFNDALQEHLADPGRPGPIRRVIVYVRRWG